jgi:hypothetical protein
MADDTWYSVAVPILEYVHEHGDFKTVFTVGLIAEATGIDPADVAVELERLVDAGFINGPLQATCLAETSLCGRLRKARSVRRGYASSAPGRATTPTRLSWRSSTAASPRRRTPREKVEADGPQEQRDRCRQAADRGPGSAIF